MSILGPGVLSDDKRRRGSGDYRVLFSEVTDFQGESSVALQPAVDPKTGEKTSPASTAKYQVGGPRLLRESTAGTHHRIKRALGFAI